MGVSQMGGDSRLEENQEEGPTLFSLFPLFVQAVCERWRSVKDGGKSDFEKLHANERPH